jgi:hypothetical protein
MTTTTFQNGVTLTDEDWFNVVDFLVYDIFGDSGTTASAAARIQSGITSLGPIQFTSTISVSAGAVFAAVQVGGVLSATSVAGAVIATQAQMESAASAGSTSLIVTPGRLQYHPGVAKGWVRFDGSATSVTSGAAYNVSHITDNGTGNYTVFWSTAFSSANYAVNASTDLANSRVASISSNSAQVICLDLSGTAADAAIISMIAFGDQ